MRISKRFLGIGETLSHMFPGTAFHLEQAGADDDLLLVRLETYDLSLTVEALDVDRVAGAEAGSLFVGQRGQHRRTCRPMASST